MKNLKPCPFCGSKDITINKKKYKGHPIEIYGMVYWKVECLDCDMNTGYCFDGDSDLQGYKNGKEMAIAKWNRRVNNGS